MDIGDIGLLVCAALYALTCIVLFAFATREEKTPTERIIAKKILPEYFEEVIKGNKRFEIRKDEDNIKAGDIVILKEWNGTEYTGREVNYRVTYVFRDVPEYGLQERYCIFCW